MTPGDVIDALLSLSRPGERIEFISMEHTEEPLTGERSYGFRASVGQGHHRLTSEWMGPHEDLEPEAFAQRILATLRGGSWQ